MKHIFPRESICSKIVCPFIAQFVSWSLGCTMGRMTMQLTRRVLVRSFARNGHSFACSALLASLARSAALICSLAHSLVPELMGKKFLSIN